MLVSIVILFYSGPCFLFHLTWSRYMENDRMIQCLFYGAISDQNVCDRKCSSHSALELRSIAG